MQIISVEQYVAEIDKAEARMEGMEQGKFEVVCSMISDLEDGRSWHEYVLIKAD
jgi:hypothetical protein